ncbi:acyl-CoA dehydrogenase family protein [Streptomyces sp. NPDC001728]|uniref:acyl-CoA dehydrogenase family protein n=1 Tax=Streptomyces sp. NPDC001728 TaxID=3154396 RepID=UPI00331662A7
MTVVDTPATVPALAAGHLYAAAARHAEESERTGRLHPEVVAAMTDAGLARHFVPRRWGGTAGGFAELIDTVAEVGAACASTAWCGVLLAAHGRLAAHLPVEGQRELWGDSPDTRVAAAVVPPAGRLTRAPGGWNLSGEWAFASGVEHAEWVLLASLDHSGAGAPVYRVLAVPRERVGVRETWDAVGLRATGSHSVVIEEADAVFVPEHRTFVRDALVTGAREEEGESVAAVVRGSGVAPCHRVPYQLVAALLFAAPALGAARGALAAWTVLTGLRRLPGGRPLSEDPVVQQALARCAAEIDAAHLLLGAAATRADDWTEDGDGAGAAVVALNQRDSAVAVDLLAGAVERLMRTGGARGLIAGGGLERAWRDIHAIAAHAALQPAPAAAAYAATVFPSDS